VLLLIT